MLLPFLGGCSMLGSGANLQQKGFYGRIAPANDSAPLPVEIAKDIESISEEGVLYIRESDVVAKVEEAINSREPSNQQTPQKAIASNGQPNLMVGSKRPGFLESNRKGPLLGANSRRSNKRGPLSVGKSNLPPLTGGKTVSYIVKWGDTLMKIAFEKYANYLRWKDIYQINKDKMESPRKMQVGTELTIENVKYVYIKKDGKPYLIRKEDTLKSISQKLYGTPDRWKEIWKNNPQLIRNPKKIYAGFTLFYDPTGVKETEGMRIPANQKEVSKAKRTDVK
jgi:nucleoid-associated protein YgaU